jgi:hypothetical protein
MAQRRIAQNLGMLGHQGAGLCIDCQRCSMVALCRQLDKALAQSTQLMVQLGNVFRRSWLGGHETALKTQSIPKEPLWNSSDPPEVMQSILSDIDPGA